MTSWATIPRAKYSRCLARLIVDRNHRFSILTVVSGRPLTRNATAVGHAVEVLQQRFRQLMTPTFLTALYQLSMGVHHT